METENRRQSEGQNITTCFGLSENTAHLSIVCEERTVDNESTDPALQLSHVQTACSMFQCVETQ